MAKIDRKTQVVFGESAGATGITEYGSPAGGTPAYSTDPDAIQTAEWQTGWSAAALAGTEIPTFQDFNGIHFVQTRQIAYILQEGIPEYDPGTEYHTNSIVKKVGTYELYGSAINSNIGNALPSATSDANWDYLGNLSDLGGTGGELPVGSLYMNSSDSTNPATLLGYGTWVAIQDAMIIGASGTYPAGSTGGSATTTQSNSQLSSHDHRSGVVSVSGEDWYQRFGNDGSDGTGNVAASFSTGSARTFGVTSSVGSSSPMTTISPYYAAYIWRRTA